MAKTKSKTEFFLLGGAISDVFNSDGFKAALNDAKINGGFQLEAFNPETDTASDLIAAVLGNDDFVSLTEAQYKEFLKIK